MIARRHLAALMAMTIAGATLAVATLVIADDRPTAALLLVLVGAVGGAAAALATAHGRASQLQTRRSGDLERRLAKQRRRLKGHDRAMAATATDLASERERLVQTRVLLDDERSRLTDTRRSLHETQRDLRTLGLRLDQLDAGASARPPATEPPSLDTTAGRRITRSEIGVSEPPRSPSQFAAVPTVDWLRDPDATDAGLRDNPFDGWTSGDVLAWLLEQKGWRYHHGIPELIEHGDLYEAYVKRVDQMLAMCDSALDGLGLGELSDLTAVDLASAEGYVAHHLLGRGLDRVDCFELNRGGSQRQLAVEAHKSISGTRIGRLDFESTNWSAALPSYDVVFALGIIYHLESPMMFARNIYELTRHAAIIESDTPHFEDNRRFRGNGVIYLHRDQVTLETGNVRHLTEMRPDRVAMAQLFLSAGFDSVEFIAPGPESGFFDRGEKSVMLCRKR